MARKKVDVIVSEYFRKLGKEHGAKGGRAAAAAMTPKERHDRALKAATVRWSKPKKGANGRKRAGP